MEIRDGGGTYADQNCISENERHTAANKLKQNLTTISSIFGNPGSPAPSPFLVSRERG